MEAPPPGPLRTPPGTASDSQDLLDRQQGSAPGSCGGAFLFALVTLCQLADLVTDTAVIVVFAQQGHVSFMVAGLVSLSLTGLLMAIMYCVQLADCAPRRPVRTVVCCLLNLPLQLGVLAHRCAHSFDMCAELTPSCFIWRRANSAHVPIQEDNAHAHQPGEDVTSPRPSGAKLTHAHWQLAKLKLLQSMLQCAPMLMINLLHMLTHSDPHALQAVSALASFVSLVLGVVAHEKARKEHLQGAAMGGEKIVCILLYKTMIIGTRVLAIVHFVYFYGALVAAILAPHVVVVVSFFVYLYRQVWKVHYYKIALHGLYSTMAYFPLHSEYRPEGEIVLFYALFLLEDVLMVVAPYGWPPTTHLVSQARRPGTRYYTAMTLIILLGALGGMVFMAIYYFVFHKSRHSIRHTNLAWLARLCEWRKRDDVQGDPHHAESSGTAGGARPARRDKRASHRRSVEGMSRLPTDDYDDDATFDRPQVVVVTPRAYQSLSAGSPQHCPTLGEVAISHLGYDVTSPGTPGNSFVGALSTSSSRDHLSHASPSVLEGDDEADGDDQEERLRVIQV